MDARPIDLTKLFEPTTQYQVPLFQRPYVWTQDKQWEPLWEDIRTAAERQTDASTSNDEEPHFMGAIVLELREAKELTYKSVIDGQQRLTSLQLILAAARAIATEEGEANLARKLGALLFFDDFLVEDPEDRYKLVPTNGDRVAFRLAAGYDVSDVGRVPIGDSSRTMEAYRYFRASIEDWLSELDETSRSDKLNALVNALRRSLRIVVIDIGREENAQAIFETMNARGTPLLAADLVKNHLFQEIGSSRAPFYYGKDWADFDTQTWRQEVGVGRAKRPRVDILLGNWLMLRGETDLHWQELFLDFRRYRAGSNLSAEDVLADLREVASTFELLEGFPLSSREGLFMYRLEILEANTMRPIALRIFGQNGISDTTDRLRALIHIESWLVRRMLCRLTTKNYNRIARALLDHLGAGSFSSEDIRAFLSSQTGESGLWPDDELLRANLLTQPYYTSISRGRLRMVLEAVEAELRGPLNLAFSDWRQLTVEHVLPQEWSHHWPLPADQPELEARITRDAAKHRLGNLTLVAQALNSSLSNAAWVDDSGGKREALRVNNVYMLNKPLVEQATWDESDIAQRGELLASSVQRLWSGPSGAQAAAPLPPPVEVPQTASPPQVQPSVVVHQGRRRRIWDEHQSLQALHEVSPELGGLGTAVMEWAATIPHTSFLKATRVPELMPCVLVHGEPTLLFTLTNEGKVYVHMAAWDRVPRLRSGDARRARMQELNDALGTSMRASNKWPSFPAELLFEESRRQAFLSSMERLAAELRVSPQVPTDDDQPGPEQDSGPTKLDERYQHFFSDVVTRWVALDPSVGTPPAVGPRNWLTVGAGRAGYSFAWSIAADRGLRVELYIDVGETEGTKAAFDALRQDEADLEAAVGEPLVWERLDHRRASRVYVRRDADPDTFDRNPMLAEWAAEAMVRMQAVFRPRVLGL